MLELELTPPTFQRTVTVLLLSSLLTGSLIAWVRLWMDWRRQAFWLDWCDEPRARWTSFAEQTALLLAFLWLSLHLSSVLSPTQPEKPPALSPSALVGLLVAGGGIAVLLPAILLSSHRALSEFGLTVHHLGRQIAVGVEGFLIAILPMTVTMLLTAPIRTRDSQNLLLKLLSDSVDPATLAIICLLAAVIAPLSEEMLFRVILQGWLISILDARFAIPLVAATFAAIHGFVDGIALLPLALVLGYVYHRRHSYIAVVVIHGLFNATMLVLALLTES